MDIEDKRNIIMNHFSQPINKYRSKSDSYIMVNSNNQSCIDNIDLYVKLENDVIKDITFDGEACAITTSSTSIMIKNLIGKRIDEALVFIQNVENMVNELPYDKDLLKEANCYDDIYKQKNRINCCLLPYKGIKKVLDKTC